MYKRIAVLLLLLTSVSPAWSQIFFGPARRVQAVTALPATCNSSTTQVDIAYLTSDGKTYLCTATNTWTAISGGGGAAPFSDATAIVKNDTDNTKLFKISASSITAANTVTASPPIATGSFTFARQDAAQTFTGDQSFSGQVLGKVANTPSSVAFGGVGGTNAGLYFRTAGTSNIASSGLCQIDFANSLGLLLPTVAPVVGWTGNSACGSGARTGLSEVAAGIVGVGSGAAAATDGWIIDSGRTRVNADVTNATATMAAITGLTATLKAGRKYTGYIEVKCNDSTAGEGIQFDFNGGTATMTSFWAGASNPVGSSVAGTVIATSLAGAMNYTTLTGENLIHIAFSLVVNAAGTYIPRFAQNSHSTGTATAELGSFMWIEDTP